MSTAERVRESIEESQELLERMARVPEGVVASLDPAEREQLVTALGELADQADKVQKGSELIVLVYDVRKLVMGRPALSTRFPMTKIRRTATREDLDAMFSGKQAQEQAAQIYNSVVKLDQGIKQEIQKLGQRSDDEHGQTSPNS